MSAKALKIAGMVLVLVPIAFFLIFAVGESASGDLSGLSHLVQAAPFAILAWAAWRWPRVGGWILVGLGLVLGALYVFTASHFPWQTIVLVEAALFVPTVLAGALFLLAARRPS